MTDLTNLEASVAKLETQNAVNKQLIVDLLAAVKDGSGIPQADVDALQARVDAVVTGEAADDTAGQAALTPPAPPAEVPPAA